MSDYHGSDDEYWDDMYYYENYDKGMDPNSWSGSPRRSTSTGFWIGLIILIAAINISPGLGEVVLIIGLVMWIIGKFVK